MSCALGFRAEAKKIHWAVVEGTRHAPRVLASDKAAAPVGSEEAKALSWYRERVRHLIESYKPNAVGVRFAEYTPRGGNTDGVRRRLRIEGVILEASDSAGLIVVTGPLATIASKLNTKAAKRYIEQGQFRGVDLLGLPDVEREAVLIAAAALPETEG